MKIIICIFSIIGLVVGAGFASGREIVSFYSRFGICSVFSVILSFFVFWFLFNNLLNFDEKSTKNSKKVSFSQIISLIITFVFSSSMFASVNNLINFESKAISFAMFGVVVFLCLLVFKNGIETIKRVNFFFIPLVSIAILVCVIILYRPSIDLNFSHFEGISFVYGIFYSILNVSNGSFVLMSLGEGLSKKQKARVSFLSALVLALLLFAVNLVLLQNPQSFSSEMPILSLCQGQFKSIMNLILLFGSITSLLSLIYTSSSLIRGLCKNEILTFFISVILPCVTSLIGFSRIIIYFYPIASTLGIFLLGNIFIEKYRNRKEDV